MTPKQTEFVRLYCTKNTETFGNASKSYEKAYKSDKMTPRGIRQSACLLLTKPNIKQAITEFRAKLEQVQEVKAEYIREQWLALLNDCKTDGVYTDRATAQAVLRTMAQSCAMLTDKYEDSTAEKPVSISKELIEELQQEAKNRLNSNDNIKLKVG